ncbi:NADP-dependent oxidoreductase [Actinocatenispora sera]|uniref:Enoyl reductase (ER) domain-containing protein n=1 Tax=Actinocatenispora sera TaxID=390989 RepID=A0A810L367_9ACTN|nr:NADP-dependent oxidoreductase [Actinocatenispora sera]BCJ29389.1 hypothetical protein Asera_34970 [Actinocatenispora sera]
MKAVRFHRYGDTDVLAYEDAPRPAPAAGQVLVRVAGSAFNPIDASIRAGNLAEVFPVRFPHVPGVEVAGTVAELGPDVTGWQPGDAVLAYLPMTDDGAAAEYVLAPAETLAAAPRTVPLADAAALPAVGLTAWQALTEVAELTAGQRILVNGAGGAVGGYAVQLAKQLGAEVTATAAARSADRLRSFGADRIIDHIEDPAAVPGAPFDVLLNLVPTTPERNAALVGLVADGECWSARRRRRSRTRPAACVPLRCSPAATPRSSRTSSAGWTPVPCASTWPSAGRWPTRRRCTPTTPRVGCRAGPS